MKKLPEREKITVIHWRPVEEPPEEGRYVLIQYIDDADDLACDPAVYENGKFSYVYDSRIWGEINERVILGWSYLPFDDWTHSKKHGGRYRKLPSSMLLFCIVSLTPNRPS